MYSKEVKLGINVKEKLNEIVCDDTRLDIEDFLFPNFETQVPYGRRKWRIVQDGHGRWREINIDGRDEKLVENKSDVNTGRNLPERTSLTRGSKLSFSNHILNSVKSSATTQSGKSLIKYTNYKELSTNTRANVFPGVGKQKWFSQTNDVYSESALKLGSQSGRDLQDEFHGITRDDLGAWNEARVHHERMKKAWDVYLESLAKMGEVTRVTQQADQLHTKCNMQNIVNRTKKVKKVEKSMKKRTEKGTVEEHQRNEHKLKDKQISPPQLEQTVVRDDDFWDFYEQPFVQSY